MRSVKINIKLVWRVACTGVLLSTLVLVGCAQEYATPQVAEAASCRALGPRALSGTLIGAAGGAAVGAGIASGVSNGNKRDTAVGALVGLLVGGAVGALEGKRLDARDCAAAQLALQKVGNESPGQVVRWSDPSTGNHGAYVAVAAHFRNSGGRICRRIQASYYMHGHSPVKGDPGIICRTTQGNWVRAVRM